MGQGQGGTDKSPSPVELILCRETETENKQISKTHHKSNVMKCSGKKKAGREIEKVCVRVGGLRFSMRCSGRVLLKGDACL